MNQHDTLSKFGIAFQTKAISAMLVDKTFLDQAYDVVDPKHFESEAQSWIVDRILWYFTTYRELPSMEVFKQELEKMANDVLKVSVVSTLRDVYRQTQASDIQYIKDEFITFCRNQTLKNAILKAADKLQTGDYDSIKNIIDKAMHAGQERKYGHNWKTDVDDRLIHVARMTVGSGWEVIDQIMDGGLGPGELGVIVAPPGVGKTWGLASIGKAAFEDGKKVVHYSLELNENYLGVRYDTLITGYEPNQMRHHIEEVKKAIANISGELIIKYYPTRSITANVLQAHLERLISTDFVPDIVLVDYGDLMIPTTKADSRWEGLGIVYEELRKLAGEMSVPVWTASQSQRSSVNEDIIGAEKIAESFHKIMIADFIMSVSRKLTDKVSNTARIHIIKNRFGPDGITFPALVNFVEGKFQIYDENSAEGVRIKKQMQDGDNIVRTMLQKKMLDFSKDESDDIG